MATTRSTTKLMAGPKAWYHTPSNLTLIWLVISLPLVIWDFGYVFLRPHSMTGGKYHSPIWVPYALYATIDYVYGFPALESKDGFTAAQSALNVLETAMYIWYLVLVWRNGVASGEAGYGSPDAFGKRWLGGTRRVRGKAGGKAVVIGFSAAVMTASKTLLYGFNEYYSGFKHIGHNDIATLIPLWIIPNGAWLVFSVYMMYVFGVDILEGLELAAAAGGTKKSQ